MALFSSASRYGPLIHLIWLSLALAAGWLVFDIAHRALEPVWGASSHQLLSNLLNQLRDPTSITALGQMSTRIAIVWILSMALVPLVSFAAAPGWLYTLRLGCLLTVFLIPSTWLEQWITLVFPTSDMPEPERLIPILARTSIAGGLWLRLHNTDARASTYHATYASLKQTLRRYAAVDSMHLLRAAPLVLCISIALCLTHASEAITHVALLGIVLVSLRLALFARRIQLPGAVPFNQSVASSLVRLFAAGIWLIPCLISLAFIPRFTGVALPATWQLVGIAALVCGIPLGLAGPVPRWLGWLSISVLLYTLLINERTNTIVALTSWQQAGLLWLSQLAITAWIIQLAWQRFSAQQAHAVSFMHTANVTQWWFVLSQPLAFATVAAVLVTGYLGSFGLASAILAIPTAFSLALWMTNSKAHAQAS